VTERTFFIVKPDAMRKGVLGKVLTMIEGGGLKLVAGRVTQLVPAQAERFYAVHKERKFFPDLVRFMSSGRCSSASSRPRMPSRAGGS
jgi:nucleoside-diphosphate kinase